MRGALHRLRSGVAVVAVAALLGAAVIGPRTLVVLYPESIPVHGEVILAPDTGLEPGQAVPGRLPIRTVVGVMEINERVPTSGHRLQPDVRAQGTVTFINRTDSAVIVPAQTELLTPSGARFRTSEVVTVPGPRTSTARASVVARDPGEIGNVGRLEIDRVVGDLATRLAVLNEEPIRGGGTGDERVVSASDRARVRTLALDRLLIGAARERGAELGEGESLIAESLRAEPLVERYDADVGATADTVGYRIQARVLGEVYRTADLGFAATESWRPSGVPAGKILLRQFARVEGPPRAIIRDGRLASVAATVSALAIDDLDANHVRALARGKSRDTARRDIRFALGLDRDPLVRIDPAFLPLTWRVDVAVDLNRPPESRP